MFRLVFRQISHAHFDLSNAANIIARRNQEQDKIRSVEGNEILILLSLDFVA